MVLSCAATLGAVIVLRLLWVFPARYLLVRPGPDAQTGERPSWRYTAVLGWAGMRGVVTLAAAFAIPREVPHRELLVLVALVVTGGTLFVQGLSLPWLVRRLRLPGPDAREDALARAALFDQATAAGLTVLDQRGEDEDPYGTREQIRLRARQRDTAAWERLGSTAPDEETPSEAYARLRREMLAAERGQILEMRSTGRLPHEVIDDVLNALDVEESMLDLGSERPRELKRPSKVAGPSGSSTCAATSRRHRPRGPRRPRGSARTASAKASPPGCTCGCACTAATWAAATPPRAGTPPRTSTRPATR